MGSSNCHPLEDKMEYPTLLNCEDPYTQVLAVIEFRSGDVADLLSPDKIALRGAETQAMNLIVDPDCVTTSDDCVGTTYDNAEEKPESQQNMKLQQGKEKSGRGRVSRRCLKAVLYVLFVFTFPMKAGGDGAIPHPTTVNITETVGNKVKLLSTCICPSDRCRLDFYNQAEEYYQPIWNGKEYDGSSGCKVDDEGIFFCIASNKNAGNYRFIDFRSNKIVCSIGLTVQTAEPLKSEVTSNNWPNVLYSATQATEPVKSGATSNSFPVGLLVACTIYVLGYFICQR